MKSLVIGLGIGKLYKQVLKELNADVFTVDLDPSKGPDFTSVKDAFAAQQYDTIHICTPNSTHENIYNEWLKTNPSPDAIAFVEKPGFKTYDAWKRAVHRKKTRIMMVKNNQYRDNIDEIISDMRNSEYISLRWINYDRVPHPGSWFTTKEKAWGGVSRDLLPHLLSYVTTAFPTQHLNAKIISKSVQQRNTLGDLISSDYGVVNHNGVFDVDDFCQIDLAIDGHKLRLIADWRSLRENDVCIETFNAVSKKHPLGLCPENAYKSMIDLADRMRSNDAFWDFQAQQDLWIHDIMEHICDE